MSYLRDLGLLEAAAARPQPSAFGKDAYRSVLEKAAALIHSLARNHALVTAAPGSRLLGGSRSWGSTACGMMAEPMTAWESADSFSWAADRPSATEWGKPISGGSR